MRVRVEIEAVVVGRKRASVEPVELALDLAAEPTLRDLIAAAVRSEVAAFAQRVEYDRFLRVLTERELADAIDAGAVRLGDRDDRLPVDVDHSIEAALAAFTDGLFAVYVDDNEVRNLDEPLVFGPRPHVVFLRLVALAGG